MEDAVAVIVVPRDAFVHAMLAMEEIFAVAVVSSRYVPHGIADVEDNASVATCLMRHTIHKMTVTVFMRCAAHDAPAMEDVVAVDAGHTSPCP